MSGYFSRLIQQTEMVLGRSEGIKAEGIEPDPNIPSLLATEREQELQSPTDQKSVTRLQGDFQFPSENNLLPTPTEFSSSTTSFPLGIQRKAEMGRNENQEFSISPSFFNQDAANGNESSSLKNATTASLSSGDSQQSQGLKNWAELSSENHDVGTGLNFPNEQPKVKPEKILESRTKVVQQTQPLPETSLPKPLARSEEHHIPRESNRVKTRQQLIAISQEDNPLPTRQVNLQTVREWVAGTENSQLNTEPLPSSETQPQELQNSVAEIENSRSNPQLFQFNAPKPQAKQNFMLSIGTISLTVEAPQTEVKQPPLPPMKPQQEVKPVSSTSRLNRHYLRL